MDILNAGEYTGEIVQKKEIDDAVITSTLYSEKECTPDWHYHENLHICFVFQNGKAETRHKTSYTKKDGSIFFYHAEERHRWISPGPVSKSANIEVGQTFLKTHHLKQDRIKNALESEVNAKSLILKMQNEILKNDRESHLTIESLLLELMSGSSAAKNQSLPIWAFRLKELLHDRWDQELSLDQIAKVVKVHPITVSKNFRRYFNCTLGEYRRRLKVEKSIDLIKHSKMTLTEIAFHCNFSDQSHFTRNFKKATGFLPKDFKAL